MNQGIVIEEKRTLTASVRIGDTGMNVIVEVEHVHDGMMAMRFDSGAYALITPGVGADFFNKDGKGELEYPTVCDPTEVLRYIITDMMIPNLANNLTSQ